MDLSRQFTAQSEIDPAISYTFRRLTVPQRAKLDLEIARESMAYVREREKLAGEGATPEELKRHAYLTWLAAEAPAVLKTTLIKATGYLTPAAFVDGHDTPQALIEEAYAYAITGIRMTQAELGEWLSRGTSPQAGTAGATNTTAPAASMPDGIERAAVGDTSPIA